MISDTPKVFIKIKSSGNETLLISAKKVELDNKKKNYEEMIPKLMEYAKRILKNNKINELSYEVIYTLCYKICIERGAEDLYGAFKKLIEGHIAELYEDCYGFLQLGEPVFFSRMVEQYNEYLNQVTIIQKTFLYFENNYLTKKGLQNIKAQSKNYFYDKFYNEKIKSLMIKYILENILIDRHGGGEMFKELVNNLVKMTDDIQLDSYEKIIEGSVLEATTNFYKTDHSQTVDVKTICEYSMYLHVNISKEIQRISDLSLTKSRYKILYNLSKETVKELLDDEDKIIGYLTNLIKINDCNHLLIFKEISQHSFLDKFYERFGVALENVGREIILNGMKSNQEDNKEYSNNKFKEDERCFNVITNILELLDKVDRIKTIFQCLNNKSHSNIIYTKLFSTINNNKEYPGLIAKQLAKYVDLTFRKMFKSKTSNQNIESEVNKIFSLFKLLKDRDVFELNHRKYLSNRLLNYYYYEEMELSLLSKLKIESGTIFTHRCEVMINDMKNSSQIMNNYRGSPHYYRNLNKNKRPGLIEINFRILTMANWIINQDENLSEDQFMEVLSTTNSECLPMVEKFSTFFKSVSKNKILRHNLFIGNCEVESKFKGKNYLINMSPFQAFVCLLFNANKKFKLSKIISVFPIKSSLSIVNGIYSLVRARILLCNDENKLIDLSKEDKISESKKSREVEISLNTNFAYKQLKIIINQTKIFKEKPKEEKGEPIVLERKYLLDSNIIRIMKSKMTIDHNNLYTELVSSIGGIFTPDSQMFKQRIENLIERGFLKRLETNYSTYTYTA